MSERLMVSCYKGLAPVSFPAEWADNSGTVAFAAENGRAQIRFTEDTAFEIWITHAGPEVVQHYRRLDEAEMGSISWGKFCPPWESYQTMKLFGHNSSVIQLGLDE